MGSQYGPGIKTASLKYLKAFNFHYYNLNFMKTFRLFAISINLLSLLLWIIIVSLKIQTGFIPGLFIGLNSGILIDYLFDKR